MAYIKLEEAIEVCNKYKTFHKKENSRLGMAIANDIYLDIDNLPIADVVEVKHGEWIRGGVWGDTGSVAYKCSACRETTYDGDLFIYCPQCGAKMDGRRDT